MENEENSLATQRTDDKELNRNPKQYDGNRAVKLRKVPKISKMLGP